MSNNHKSSSSLLSASLSVDSSGCFCSSRSKKILACFCKFGSV